MIKDGKCLVRPCPACKGQNMMGRQSRVCLRCSWEAKKKPNTCRKCSVPLNENNWVSSFRNAKKGKNYICKQCFNADARIRHAQPARRETYYKYYKGIKQRVMTHYGGKCVCCGETHLAFLTLDHINDDGAEQRKRDGNLGGQVLYRKLLKEGFRDDLQCLCMNCNFAKSHWRGGCPHQSEK